MKRPDWLPVKLWKELRKWYPEVKRRAWPANKVSREPRIYLGATRQHLAAEYYPATAEVHRGEILLSWQTGTPQRGNDWGFLISEETLLAWLEGLRDARREKEAQRQWHESHLLDVLFAWLQRHEPTRDWDLYEVRNMLMELDAELEEEALRKSKTLSSRRKPLARKPAAKKKAVAKKRPAARRKT